MKSTAYHRKLPLDVRSWLKTISWVGDPKYASPVGHFWTRAIKLPGHVILCKFSTFSTFFNMICCIKSHFALKIQNLRKICDISRSLGEASIASPDSNECFFLSFKTNGNFWEYAVSDFFLSPPPTISAVRRSNCWRTSIFLKIDYFVLFPVYLS